MHLIAETVQSLDYSSMFFNGRCKTVTSFGIVSEDRFPWGNDKYAASIRPGFAKNVAR